MTKQTKRDKAAKKGKAKAEAIIDDLYASKADKKAQHATYADSRLETASDAEYALGVAIRTRRDAGEAWWAIAQALGLEGAGTSAATGKKGAGRARSAYAKAFGKHEPSFVRGQGKSRQSSIPEKNAHVAKLSKSKATDRIKKVRKGKAVLDMALTDEELCDMVRGRKIKWSHFNEQLNTEVDGEATVHPRGYVHITGEGKSRQLHFQEMHHKAPVAVRGLKAHQRSIYLASVHTVK